MNEVEKHFYKEKQGRFSKKVLGTNGVEYELRLNNKNSYNLYINDILVLNRKAKKTIINYMYNNYRIKIFAE